MGSRPGGCIFLMFLSLLLQCKYNVSVSTQILLLFYPVCCPGLKRLQCFDFCWLRNSSDVISDCTGWRPVVAAYQSWPFAFCTGKYVFIAKQNRQLRKRKQKESPLKRLVKFSVCKAKSRQLPQPTHMPTSRHFLGTTAHQTYIIKCRNKHVQSAALMFTYHEKE